MALRALSLCAGIGGLDLALRSLGVVSVGYVERDAFAASVLVDRMEDASLDPGPIWSDLATFDARSWRGAVDLVAAGYPCQPFSCAGKQRGEDDERHLWPHVARVVRDAEPTLVVLENVPGHVKLGLREVLGDLAALGFDSEWAVFSAASVGAPHRRERVFVVAWRVSDAGRAALRKLAERDELGPAERGDAELGDLGRAGGADGNELGGESEPVGLAASDRGSGASVGLVADADGPRRFGGGEPSDWRGLGGPPWDELDGRERPSSVVGDAERSGLRVARSARERPADDGEPGAIVGDAIRGDGERLHAGRGEARGADERREPPGSFRERDASAGGDESRENGVDDAALAGLQGPNAHARQQPPRAWPPGPSDRIGWAEVIAERPDLAPAILRAPEPGLRGVADGTPGGVDGDAWADRLRCLGNAVVPLQAATAIRALARRALA